MKYLITIIASAASIIVPDKKGKKRVAGEAAAKNSALKDYIIEYAKSGRAVCRGCEIKIVKDEVRKKCRVNKILQMPYNLF